MQKKKQIQTNLAAYFRRVNYLLTGYVKIIS